MYYISKGFMGESKRGNGVGVGCVFFLQDFFGAQHCHCSMEFQLGFFSALQKPKLVTVIN